MTSHRGVRPVFRLAVLSTHPIQYHTPWFQAMHRHPQLELSVFYGHRASPQDQSRAGFGVEFEWDIPLLEGYSHRFLRNVAREPGFHFNGIDTPEIGRIVEEGQFDAMLIQGWHYRGAWQALRACRSKGIKALVRSDSQLPGPRSGFTRSLKWLPYRLFIPRFDACVAVGKRSREYFLHYGARPERIFEVPHTIGERWFEEPPSVAEKRELRRKYELPQDGRIFVFVGKLEAKKRPLDFLEAATRLSDDRVVALVVGDGVLLEECRKKVEGSVLNARFVGFINQNRMPTIYALADMLVLPSDGGETWGLVVNEAMARGLPCLVSREVGCAPDLIREGETGSTFESGRIGSLEEKMRQYLSDWQRLETMGLCARRRAEAYRPSTAVEAVLRMLSTLRGQ